jgi:hypothetical protein
MGSYYINPDNVGTQNGLTAATGYTTPAAALAARADVELELYCPQVYYDAVGSGKRWEFTTGNDRNVTISPWPENPTQDWRITGQRVLSGITLGGGTNDVYTATLASGLDAAGAGTGVVMLAIDDDSRPNEFGQPCSLLHRRTDVRACQTITATITRASNVLTITLTGGAAGAAATIFRVGDLIDIVSCDTAAIKNESDALGDVPESFWTVKNGTATANQAACQMMVSAIGASTLTCTLNGADVGSATNAVIAMRVACFHYLTGSGATTFRAKGLTSLTEARVRMWFGGGATAPNGVVQGGTGRTLTFKGNWRIDSIGTVETQDGNGLLLNGVGANFDNQGVGLIDRCADHCCNFTDSANVNLGDLTVRDLMKDDGDSLIVFYTASASAPQLFATGRVSLIQSLAMGFDSRGNHLAVATPQGGADRSIGQWGITSHVNVPLRDVIHRGRLSISARYIPQHFNRPTGYLMYGYGVQAISEVIQPRDTRHAPLASPADEFAAAAFQIDNLVIDDAPSYTPDATGQFMAIRNFRIHVTGYDRAGVFYVSNSRGALGQVGNVQRVQSLHQAGVIVCNVVANGQTCAIEQAIGSASSHTCDRRHRGVLKLFTGRSGAQTTRVLDPGQVQSGDVAELYGGTQLSAAATLGVLRNVSNTYAMDDCAYGYVGLDATQFKFFSSNFSNSGPLWNYRRMIPMRRGRVWGFADTGGYSVASEQLGFLANKSDWEAGDGVRVTSLTVTAGVATITWVGGSTACSPVNVGDQIAITGVTSITSASGGLVIGDLNATQTITAVTAGATATATFTTRAGSGGTAVGAVAIRAKVGYEMNPGGSYGAAPAGFTAAMVWAISAAVKGGANNTVATYTAAGHTLSVGDKIALEGITPQFANGVRTVASVSGNDFTVSYGPVSIPGTMSVSARAQVTDLDEPGIARWLGERAAAYSGVSGGTLSLVG